MARISKEEKAEAIARLQKWIPKGSTVYTITRHVSRSGMQRSISLVAFSVVYRCGSCGRIETEDYKSASKCPKCNILTSPEPSPSWLSWNVAKALGLPHDDRREAVKVGGCGMDMGWHLVYELASVLYGDSNALTQKWL